MVCLPFLTSPRGRGGSVVEQPHQRASGLAGQHEHRAMHLVHEPAGDTAERDAALRLQAFGHDGIEPPEGCSAVITRNRACHREASMWAAVSASRPSGESTNPTAIVENV